MATTATIRRYWIRAIACAIVATSGRATFAQQSPAPAVQPASLDRPASREQQRTVQFGRRVGRIGDEVDQRLSFEMRLNTSLRQGNELINKSRTFVRTAQRRLVRTIELDRERPTAVQVRYLEATKDITTGEPAEPSTRSPQPVAGKTYLCRRAPENGAELVVTDLEGRTPSLEELEIVSQTMEMVGRPNPLLQFLAGRTMRVGETLELPKELAEQVFTLGGQWGEVTRFDLLLENVESRDGASCAQFTARVEAASNDSSQMRMQMEGPLLIQIDTCRAVRLALSGPIGMSETRGSYSTIYQLIGTGQLTMSIDSTYRDAGQ